MKQAQEGQETGAPDALECVAPPQGAATHEMSATHSAQSRPCPQCGEKFAPKTRWQTFCSHACRKAHFRLKAQAEALKEPPKLPRKGREAKDGLRCRTCNEFIDNREGYRLDCKSCSRKRMLALHNPARCTRPGCIVCMNATLAQSVEFVASLEPDEAA